LKTVKTVKFAYQPNQSVSLLLETFRRMCNDAIRIGLTAKPNSRFELIRLAYRKLKEYNLHTLYILSACEVAFSICKNKRANSNPYVKRAFLKLGSQAYRLDYLLLRIPISAKRFIYLPLDGSPYHLSFLADESLKRGSVTITDSSVLIAFSKEPADMKAVGKMGIDVNEKNVTWSDTSGNTKTHGELADVVEIQERYKEIRAKISARTKNDRRIQQGLLSRYGKRERNRTVQRIHKVSREIVEHAKEKGLVIIMERLTGIRKLYRKKSGQGNSYRGRMNSWMFREIQRQVAYKATWEGISVTFVNPRGTSRNCPDCGSRVVSLQERKLFCVECDKTWDRDVLASRNIMAAVVPAVRPSGWSSEGESRMQEGAGNPQAKGWKSVVGKTDGTYALGGD